MANTDYEIRGSGSITPSASLALAINEGAAEISIADYTSNDLSNPVVGAGLMIGGEIMRVVSVALPLIGVARGCADTIPAKHAAGAKAWFFTSGGGADTREYMGTEVIAVKVLMKSTASTMPVKSAAPRRLAFNQRFARPYPPGLVLVNGLPFHLSSPVELPVDLTWAHRDRITQNDTLHGHEVGDIGPEIGTTYTLRVYTAGGTLVHAIAGIEGTTASYSLAEAIADFGLSPGDTASGYITLHSVRDGFESWQGYRIDFTVSVPDDPGTYGWGLAWGSAWSING